MRNRAEMAQQQLAAARRDLRRATPQARLDSDRQRVDDAQRTLSAYMAHRLRLSRERLRGRAAQLHALSPLLTIARGYAVVQRELDGELVSSVKQVVPGQGLTIRVTDGAFAATAGHRQASTPDMSVAPDMSTIAPQRTGARRRQRVRVPVAADTLLTEEGTAHNVD
jgi:exonuclease VII large subunit